MLTKYTVKCSYISELTVNLVCDLTLKDNLLHYESLFKKLLLKTLNI